MIETFLRPKLNQFIGNHEERKVWFQQDGLTAHTWRHSLTILGELFPRCLLSLRADIVWPPRSSDLSPCDFFYMRTFKGASIQTSSQISASTQGGNYTSNGCHSTGTDTKNYGQLPQKAWSMCQQWRMPCTGHNC
ncbi:hypothetical protein Trydic_g3403 [Trypoxylus dichotomus]